MNIKDLDREFLNSPCLCNWVNTKKPHKKKDCPYYSFNWELEFIHEKLSQSNQEIVKEMVFNPETDNFELDIIKAEKLFNNEGEI